MKIVSLALIAVTMSLGVAQAETSVQSTDRLVLVMVRYGTGSFPSNQKPYDREAILRSIYVRPEILNQQCFSPNTVILKNGYGRLNGKYINCRWSLTFISCDQGALVNCHELNSIRQDLVETFITSRKSKYSNPGLDTLFLMGSDAYNLDPTIIEFARAHSDQLRQSLYEIMAGGHPEEIVFHIYETKINWFERYVR